MFSIAHLLGQILALLSLYLIVKFNFLLCFARLLFSRLRGLPQFLLRRILG